MPRAEYLRNLRRIALDSAYPLRYICRRSYDGRVYYRDTLGTRWNPSEFWNHILPIYAECEFRLALRGAKKKMGIPASEEIQPDMEAANEVFGYQPVSRYRSGCPHCQCIGRWREWDIYECQHHMSFQGQTVWPARCCNIERKQIVLDQNELIGWCQGSMRSSRIRNKILSLIFKNGWGAAVKNRWGVAVKDLPAKAAQARYNQPTQSETYFESWSSSGNTDEGFVNVSWTMVSGRPVTDGTTGE